MNLITYVKDSISELRKVTWPTKKQAINYTIIVVVLAIGMAIFFAVLDQLFNLGLEHLI